MDQIAKELNEALEGSQALHLLSDFGKRIFFPKGIIAQSAEAKEKAKRYDATIGMAVGKKGPFVLSGVKEELAGLSQGECVAYAPTAGIPDLRKAWKEDILRKNPSLDQASLSLPVLVPGLTAGVALLGDLFLDPGDIVVLPDLYWENYQLIFEHRMGAEIRTFRTFTESGGFDVGAFGRTLAKAADERRKVFTILNFPNNPTGYSPTEDEAERIRAAIGLAAEKGYVLAVADDAYFGFFYEENLIHESVFSKFALISEKLLAVKVDGPTKEDCVWGFRSGFITFAGKGMDAGRQTALEKKLMGAIRSSVSCSTTPTQHILLRAMRKEGHAEEREVFKRTLKERYLKAKEAIERGPVPSCLKPLPFNSGYFMCFRCVGIDGEALRKKLLEEHGIGTICIGDILRVAFSSVEAEVIPDLYARIFEAAAALSR